MAANIRCIMRAKAPYGQGITKMKVKLTPEQSSTPSLMPETNSVYLTRPTEGTGELMELVGGSVAWNQFINMPDATRTMANGISYTRSNGTHVEFSGTNTGSTAYTEIASFDPTFRQNTFIAGHKFLLKQKANKIKWVISSPYTDVTGYDYVLYAPAATPTYCYLRSINPVGEYSEGEGDVGITDLTQMLGPTIADYVYSLEQATAGSGIAWLKSYGYFTEDYYAYSAPTLQSVEATSHVTVGFNQWDEVWEIGGINNITGQPLESSDRIRSKNFCPCFPRTNYYGKIGTTGVSLYIWWYDASQNFIRGDSITNVLRTFPANAYYFKLSTYGGGYNSYQNDICVNIPKTTGTPKNGDYVPYVKHTTPLGSVTLRGILKTDENGNLYYDGDTYEWDGTVNRRFAEVDLGSLSWNKVNTSTGHWRFGVSIASMKGTGDNSTKFKCVCTKYLGITPNESYTGVTGITANGADGALFVCDESYSDAAAFKTAMSGVMLVYEMVSATTESADPFTAVQTVEDGGTEEFVTTNGVPVGVVGRFANAVPMEGVDSFTVTADDGTTHTYPVTLSEEIYRGYVDMLTGEAVSDMASIAEYNGETISEPWLSSLDVYSAGATPTNGAQVVYPITPEEVTATITGDPSTLSGVVSATSTEGTVEWSELSEIGIKCIMKRKNPFQ